MLQQGRGQQPARPKPEYWSPFPGSQVGFLQSAGIVPEVLYCGTRGPGKTTTLLADFCQDVGKGFGNLWRGPLFRQTYKELNDVIEKSKPFMMKYHPDAVYNEALSQWRFPDGELLMFRRFKKPDDYWGWHGHELPWQGWEELTTWPDLVGYKRMISCMRSSHPELARRARIRSTTNPYGVGHNQVKRRFQLPQMMFRLVKGDVDPETGDQEPDRMAIHGDIQENLALMAAEPNYMGKVLAAARNANERRAWSTGSWEITSGGIVDDIWDPRVHVVDDFRVPRSWKVDRSYDHGSSKPFAVGFWAESDGTDLVFPDGSTMSTVPGDLFLIGEYYGTTGQPDHEDEGLRLTPQAIARGIVQREKSLRVYGRCEPGPADGQIFDSDPGVPSVATQMAEPITLEPGVTVPGIGWDAADKSSGSVEAGIEVVRQMLENAKRPRGGVREKAGLFVCRSCPHWLRTVPTAPRDDKNQDRIPDTYEDHLWDMTRYRVRKKARPVVRYSRTTGHY